MMPESADGLWGPECEIVSQGSAPNGMLPTKNVVVDQNGKI